MVYNGIIKIEKGFGIMNYAEKELKRLADFLLERHPQEVEGVNFNGDEGAVDVAIRLLSDGGRFVGVRDVLTPVGEFGGGGV